VSRSLIATAFAIWLLCPAAHCTAAFVSTWDGSSGLLPSQLDPPWTLTDTASPENPVLSGGVLTISTSAIAENMSYLQSGGLVDTSGDFYMEARVRRVSGTSTSSNRAPIAIGWTTTPNTGNYLFIGSDEIFLNAPGDVKGAAVSVDTDNVFHTYRIEVSTGGAFKVFYDSVQVLTGVSHVDAGVFGPTPRIFWGEASLLATGTSEWTRFEHNALSVPEPASIFLAASGAMLIGAYRSRRKP
jgi:hypothetical protein